MPSRSTPSASRTGPRSSTATTLTWREYHEERNRLARKLAGLGLGPRDNVVVYLKRLVDLSADVRRRYDVSSMRSIVVAAAPCCASRSRSWPGSARRSTSSTARPSWASTPCSVPTRCCSKPGSCGRAAPGVALAVLGPTGEPLPPGEPGELAVRRGPGVFDGYYKRPDATRETERGEWLTVGDVAWLDTEGFVHVCDRRRDMIISGGVNIYPAEIEDALHRHPDVDDAAVFGVPDDEWGERVHAAVRLRPSARLAADNVIDFCRARLADYRVPREVSFHDDCQRGPRCPRRLGSRACGAAVSRGRCRRAGAVLPAAGVALPHCGPRGRTPPRP